jgi:hypothetical protein
MAYLAGILDGEGHLGMYSRGQGRKKLRPVMEVKMTDKQVIELLAATFGGSVYKTALVPGRKQQWRWRIKDNRALGAHKAMLPYLRIKLSFD